MAHWRRIHNGNADSDCLHPNLIVYRKVRPLLTRYSHLFIHNFDDSYFFQNNLIVLETRGGQENDENDEATVDRVRHLECRLQSCVKSYGN